MMTYAGDDDQIPGTGAACGSPRTDQSLNCGQHAACSRHGQGTIDEVVLDIDDDERRPEV